jgi:hypothetical protein
MGQITAGFILQMVSNSLVEWFVNTTLGTTIVAGIQTVAPPSMRGIYQGAMVIVGTGADIEQVTVSSVTASTFTADFLSAHPSTDPVTGATFSSGQPTTPLWTQQEMLSYLVDVQNDFLSAVRPVYKIATQTLSVGVAAYPNPSDAIRVERISVNGTELWDCTQTDIDWQGGYSSRAGQGPFYWYQDKVGPFNFAVDPIPQSGFPARIFYSQLGSTSLGLLSTLTAPDIFWHILKYGVLANAFSKDGEQRDLMRSAYCQQRFDFGCLISAKFLEGLEARFRGPEETVEPMLAMMKGGR